MSIPGQQRAFEYTIPASDSKPAQHKRAQFTRLPTASYKWGITTLLGKNDGTQAWHVVAWFKTRREAEICARCRYGSYAIARVGRLV